MAPISAQTARKAAGKRKLVWGGVADFRFPAGVNTPYPTISGTALYFAHPPPVLYMTLLNIRKKYLENKLLCLFVLFKSPSLPLPHRTSTHVPLTIQKSFYHVKVAHH